MARTRSTGKAESTTSTPSLPADSTTTTSPGFIVGDPVIAGTLRALGHEVKGFPEPSGKVAFEVRGGNVKESLTRIYANEPIPAMDILEGVKYCRGLIYLIRDRGRE